MSESNSTILQMDNDELVYYKELEKYINSLSKKFFFTQKLNFEENKPNGFPLGDSKHLIISL